MNRQKEYFLHLMDAYMEAWRGQVTCSRSQVWRQNQIATQIFCWACLSIAPLWHRLGFCMSPMDHLSVAMWRHPSLSSGTVSLVIASGQRQDETEGWLGYLGWTFSFPFLKLKSKLIQHRAPGLMKVKVKVAPSCLTLCDPMDYTVLQTVDYTYRIL